MLRFKTQIPVRMFLLMFLLVIKISLISSCGTTSHNFQESPIFTREKHDNSGFKTSLNLFRDSTYTLCIEKNFVAWNFDGYWKVKGKQVELLTTDLIQSKINYFVINSDTEIKDSIHVIVSIPGHYSYDLFLDDSLKISGGGFENFTFKNLHFDSLIVNPLSNKQKPITISANELTNDWIYIYLLDEIKKRELN